MIRNEDLIENTYYYSEKYSGTLNNNFILKYEKDVTSCSFIPDFMNKNSHADFHNDGTFNHRITRLATDEEIHWFKICFEAKSYIKYEEAMKTFNQIKPTIQDDPNLGEILIKLLNN